MKNFHKAISTFGFALMLAVLLLLGYWRVASDISTEVGTHSRPSSSSVYLRAAHWFGDAWQINFWNTDLEAIVERDFQRIVDDGFNTVVLVVPWPGFAPDPRVGDLDPERSARLLGLMRTAEDFGLRVVLRVAYSYDSSESQVGTRLTRLWFDDGYLEGWLEYLESLWELVRDEPNFEFAFFSWEDLWALTHFADTGLPTRLRAAKDTDFRSWLASRYALEDLEEYYRQPFSSWSEVPLPRRNEPAFRLFLEFLDHSWIERFFVPARNRFPKLSMEIRIDSDAVRDGEELLEWYGHQDAWDLPGAEWVTLYWSPAMGGLNTGESLSPELAAERLEWWLRQVGSHIGDKKIFIGQFLAQDFTPGYERNGRVPGAQIHEFLERAGDVLAQWSSGYGLWAWADYGHDAIAFPEFGFDLESWEYATDVSTIDRTVELPPESWIKRRILRQEYHVLNGPESATLCVTASAHDAQSARLRVRDALQDVGLGAMSFGPDFEKNCIEIAVEDVMEIQLAADSTMRIERVSSVGFVQESGMRDIDRRDKPVAVAYRSLNERLHQSRFALRPLWPDRWMGSEIRMRYEPLAGHERFRLETYLPKRWPIEPKVEVWINGRLIDRVPCRAGGVYNYPLSKHVHAAPLTVRLVSSHTHRVDGDERALGCVIRDLGLVDGA